MTAGGPTTPGGSVPAAVPVTTGDLAQRIGARLTGAADVCVTGLSTIDEARSGDLTFISDQGYAAQWPTCQAAAAIVLDSIDFRPDHSGRPLLFVSDVDQAMIAVLAVFPPPEDRPDLGVHPTAFVAAGVQLGQAIRVGPHVTIGRNCVIGDGVTLYPGVRVYSGVQIGAGSIIHANTVIRERCVIGRGVILHQNISIGGDGFGYRPSPDGRGLLKMPHIGIVVLEDGVEIGSGSCVDRAKFGATVIGAGTKIDNLVQIAHNCRVGRCCLIAGQSGLGGSVTLGDGVLLGGAVGVVDHLSIGSRAKVGARSLVTRDVPAGASWLGTPADEGRATLRHWALIKRLPELAKRLDALEHIHDQAASGHGIAG